MEISIKKVLSNLNAKGVIYLDGVSHDTVSTPELDNCNDLANAFDLLCDYTKQSIEIKAKYEYLNYFLFDHYDNKTDVIVSFVTVDNGSEEIRLLSEVVK